ncbi:MAG TPA: YggT family protein [Gammaproteobacteria bacterium]|nr:YggT family protein [Gammaproteobacteria bacterium]
MTGYLANPLAFLVNTVVGLYIFAVMLRFLLQWLRADFFNPISQFLVRITQPVLRPMRRVIPGFAGIDVSSLVLLVLLQMGLLVVLSLIAGQAPRPIFIIVRTPVELLSRLFDLYIFAIIIQAVLSWVDSGGYNPVQTLLYSLTEPVVRPFRQIIPPISGIDLSPLAAIIMLQVLRMLVMPLLNHVTSPFF